MNNGAINFSKVLLVKNRQVWEVCGSEFSLDIVTCMYMLAF